MAEMRKQDLARDTDPLKLKVDTPGPRPYCEVQCFQTDLLYMDLAPGIEQNQGPHVATLLGNLIYT